VSVHQALAKVASLRAAKRKVDERKADEASQTEEAERLSYSGLSTQDLVPYAYPGYDKPAWFSPYTDVLDTAVGGGHEVVVAGPPQHGKTVCTVTGLLRWLIRRPDLRFGYATYNTTRSLSVARDVRATACRIGLELSGPVDAPRTSDNGGVFFVGRGGGATGEPITGFGVVDDPFKDPKEANSITIRNTADEWYTKVWDARIHPGASKIVMATRWHEDDLSGRLVGRDNYHYLNIPAIAGEEDVLGRQPGEALSPHWPIDSLHKKLRKDKRAFWALYQGKPLPEGESVFGPPKFFSELPPMGCRVGIGVDLAYSKKTSSDFCVIVVVHAYDIPTDDGVTTLYYVTNVIRRRMRMPEFVEVLADILRQYPGVKARYYYGGFELGVPELISDKLNGLDVGTNRFEAVRVNQDKLIRAYDTSMSWNSGAILVPHHAPWTVDFVEEVCRFQGNGGDLFDDQVDGLAAAHDSVAKASKNTGYWSMSESSMWQERTR
jgi:predicted phage terminase large subunit-like protein